MKVAPSILAADFANLAADVARVAPVSDLLHVDCMDGHYVPNLTIGPPVVKALRKHTDLFLDCHLMVDNPGVLLRAFADAGADGCTIHVELGDPHPLIAAIRELGMRVGLALEPETPLAAAEPYLGDIDLLLVMSVHTGFGGQPFIADVLDKVRAARAPRRTTAPGRDRDRRWHQGRHCAARSRGGRRHPRFGNGHIRRRRSRGGRARSAPRRLSIVRAKVLTVSDGVAGGTRDDKSGRACVEQLAAAGYEVVEHRVTADGVDAVASALRELTDGFAGLVVTTGGTGFGPRDCTPEGTLAVLEREASGIVEAIRRASDADGRGFGMLSRAVAGTRGAALVCNLPGSASGAQEGLGVLLPIVPHALDLLGGGHPH